MSRPSVKIESKGSYWWFDEQAHEYLRLPKHEGPRERPEWSDQRAGALQDAVWHAYEGYEVMDQYHERGGRNAPPGLYITLPTGKVAFAPPPITITSVA